MPRNRSERALGGVGGGGKGGRTVGGVRGAGNGGSKTAPSNRSMPHHPIGPLDPAPSSGATALAFLISEFRIPYGVWGGGRGRGRARVGHGASDGGIGHSMSDSLAKGEGSGRGIHGPLNNKKPRRANHTGRARGTGGLGDSRKGDAEHSSNAEGPEEQPPNGAEEVGHRAPPMIAFAIAARAIDRISGYISGSCPSSDSIRSSATKRSGAEAIKRAFASISTVSVI